MLKLDYQTVLGVCNNLNVMENLYNDEKTSLPVHLRTAQELIWLLWADRLRLKGVPLCEQTKRVLELANEEEKR